MLASLTKRVKELGIGVEFSQNAVEAVGKAGFDPVYGARPLRRAIQQRIEDKLSEEILEGKNGKSIAVISHGGIIRILVKYIDNHMIV